MIDRTSVRWFASFGSFSVPQAAAPIAFALVALPLTGDANDGAALVLAMTLTQVLGAVPVARLGARFNAVSYLRVLVLARTLALGALAGLAGLGTPFVWLVVAAAAAGLVNGAAYGYHRAVLNYLVVPAQLPRALGIAATLNELTFVSAPVLASALGAVSPVFAVAALSILGAGPLLLLPAIPQANAPAATEPTVGRVLTPRILLWLACATATSSAVAAVEIGAVALVIGFGFDPTMGFIFPVILCVASVAGGVVVSVRNRMAHHLSVVAFLTLTAIGTGLVATNTHIILTGIGAVLIGCFLAPLNAFYSLSLDQLAPPGRRAEVFALLRTATSIGVITISLILTATTLPVALTASAVLVTGATIVAATSVVAGRHEHRGDPGAPSTATRSGDCPR